MGLPFIRWIKTRLQMNGNVAKMANVLAYSYPFTQPADTEKYSIGLVFLVV